MTRFIVSVSSFLSEEELARRLGYEKFNSDAVELFVALVVGSPGDGAVMREYHRNGESLAFSLMDRMDYERAVESAVREANLSPEQKKLAFDVAQFSYSWGYQNPRAGSVASKAALHLRGLLNVIKERSDADDFQKTVGKILGSVQYS